MFKNILSWFFGGVFLIFGLGLLTTKTLITSTLLIVLSLLLLPPSRRFFYSKTKITIPTSFKTILIFVLVIAVVVTDKDKPVNESSEQILTAKEKDKPISAPPPIDYAKYKEDVRQHFISVQEKTTKDAIWATNNIFKVGVLDDGTIRNGYAEYVCSVLYDYHFKGQSKVVQVIDIVELKQNGKWQELGKATCI